MRTLDQILVKKDYSQPVHRTPFYKDSPLWQKLLAAGCIFFLSCAGLGEWKVLNNSLGGVPKAITVGVIGLAVLYTFFYPDMERIRDVAKPTLMFLSLMAALFLWSVVIWILHFMNLSSMIRGCSKLVFQSISILTAVCLVYLFREKAVDLFTFSMCLSNGAIMLLEIPSYGLGPSIQSLITCLVTFGEAEGYARQLEIHDLTFVFGQLLLYYVVFAPRDTPRQNRQRWLFIFACSFFFLVGMKRIAIPAAILFILVGLFFRDRRMPGWFYPAIGVAWIVFFLIFLYFVHSGLISVLLNRFGIDMMGRDYLWSMAGDYYDFSITYVGHGFEYVDSIIAQWYNAGLINHPYPFHNDILKVFVELGFPGFIFWSVIQYVLCTIFWQHYADEQTTLLYLCELSYMTITYLTDNTSFYFWSTMALRLVAFAYSVERRKPAKPKWQPPDRKAMQDRICILMQES